MYLRGNDKSSVLDFPSSLDTHINFTVDWLSFTCVSSTDNPLEDAFIRKVIYSVYPEPSNVFVEGKGRFSYLRAWVCTGCMILYSPAANATQDSHSCHIIFDGTGLRLARTVLTDVYEDWLTLIQSQSKIVRLDLALDIFDCPNWDKIQYKIDSHDYVSAWRSFSVTRSDHDGYTASFGKRGQNYYCRIYNKLAEQTIKKCLPSDFSCKSWYRIELECRDVDVALRNYPPLHYCITNASLLRFFVDSMRLRLRINGLPTYFFFDGIPIVSEPSVDAYVDPVNKQVAWVERQVVPTLDRLTKIFGPCFLNWICGYSGYIIDRRLNPKVGERLAEYFAWYCPDVLAPKLLHFNSFLRKD